MTIPTRKLRRDAAEAVHLVNRPWYRTPEVFVPRQYAQLGVTARVLANELGMAELIRRSGLPAATIKEILS